MNVFKNLFRVAAVTGALALAISPAAFAEKAPLPEEQPNISSEGAGPHTYPGKQSDVARSDGEIESDVEKALENHKDVSVDVKDRVVTLSGTVADDAEHQSAIDAARKTPGVHMVQDQIQVTSTEKQSVAEFFDDTAITAEVKAKILVEKDLSALDISVDTVDGVVTLTGSAKSQALAERAEQIARQVKGVKQVDNKLLIEP